MKVISSAEPKYSVIEILEFANWLEDSGHITEFLVKAIENALHTRIINNIDGIIIMLYKGKQMQLFEVRWRHCVIKGGSVNIYMYVLKVLRRV